MEVIRRDYISIVLFLVTNCASKKQHNAGKEAPAPDSFHRL
jgi:hypothetical protein